MMKMQMQIKRKSALQQDLAMYFFFNKSLVQAVL